MKTYLSVFKKSMRTTSLMFFFLFPVALSAQNVGDYRTRAGGNWSNADNWQRFDGTTWVQNPAQGYPGQNTGTGHVSIRDGHNVTLNVSPSQWIGSLAIEDGGTATSLTSYAYSLSMYGDLTITSASSNVSKSVFFDAGILRCNNVNIHSLGGDNTRDAFIRLRTGVLVAVGNITMNAVAARTYIRFSGHGTIRVGGTMSGGNITSTKGGGTDAPTYGTVQYNGTGNQTIGSYTYYNLTVSGGGTKSLGNSITVSNVLSLSGAVVRIGNYDLTINSTAAAAITGTFSKTNMIETNGTGYVLKNTGTIVTTHYPYTVPLGSDGLYAPVELSYISGTSLIRFRTQSFTELGTRYLQRAWDVWGGTARRITATFTHDPSEALVVMDKIRIRPATGWTIPVGTQSFGASSFTITDNGTNNLRTGETLWTASGAKTLFSYKSGNWNDATTWTDDPSGTTLSGSEVPANEDVIVILSGRNVVLTENTATTDLEVNISAGGVLDLAGFNFTAGLKILNGQGRLRLRGTTFPNVTESNGIIAAGGGTVEFYNPINFNLPTTPTSYNNLEINTGGSVATQMNNLTLNGNLHIKTGTFQINDNTATRRTLDIFGNVIVDNGASILVGKGVTNTVTTAININLGAAPYLNYYIAQSHTVKINGDFTNNGTVKFTNIDYPVYNSFPPTTLGATTGFASVYFTGNQNNTLTCNGTTIFYNLILSKGTDQSYKLTVNSSDYSNFKLYGANTATIWGAVNANPNIRKALWIHSGTLELTGSVIIPSLTEGLAADNTTDYIIPESGALLLNGVNVAVFGTADDYREINTAYGVDGGTGSVNGLNLGSRSAVSVHGKLQILNGVFSTKESRGLITGNAGNPQILIDGGTLDVKQFSPEGALACTFSQSNGTVNARGRFKRTPTEYTTVRNLTDMSETTLDLVRANNGVTITYASFDINSNNSLFTMLGGTLRIYDNLSNEGFGINISSLATNSNVTGGTIEIRPIQGSTESGTNFGFNMLLRIRPSVGNLHINRKSGSSRGVRIFTYPLVVVKDITITAGLLNASDPGLDVTIGGDFSISPTGSYSISTNSTIFNGTTNQTFTVNTVSPLSIQRITVDKPVGTILSFAGTQSFVNNLYYLDIREATLNLGDKTLTFSNTSNDGYIYNSGIIQGDGKLVFSSNQVMNIEGDGNGVFSNLDFNNTNAANAPVSFLSAFTINGTLNLLNDKLVNIGTNNITFGESASVVGASSTRYFITNGQAGDGGITKIYNSTSAFTFPVGAPSTVRPESAYTPATLGFTAAPATYGSVTVVPVGAEHPATTVKNRSLTYFWRVKSTGFVLGGATVNHSFTYNETDVTLGGDISEEGYIPARLNTATLSWEKGSASDINTGTNLISGAFLTGSNFIDGEFTAGDNVPTDPFGLLTTFYSRQNGWWGDFNTWSTTGHSGVPDGAVPGEGDIVFIGGNDSVWFNYDLTTPNTDDNSCAILKIASGSVLDIGYNPGSVFGMVSNNEGGNGKIRITTDRGPLDWTTVRTFEFPGGDFTDFNVNQGITELYTTNPTAGTTFYLPNGVTSYGNLAISPLGGSNIIFPNHDLTIYGDLSTYGQNADSWFCPAWNTVYPTEPQTVVAKTVTIIGDMNIFGGGFVWYGAGAVKQSCVVHGNILVNGGSCIDNWDASSAELQIGGSLINNTLGGIAGGTSTPRECNFGDIPVTFFGSGTSYITNTSGTPVTTFGNLTINKESLADSVILNIGSTVNTPTNAWFTLNSGMFVYSRGSLTTELAISTNSLFTISQNAGFHMESANSTIRIGNAASNIGDLLLEGKLTIVSGTVNIGVSTNNNNNDIEYTGNGSAEINIQGGSLFVNGQIRRNPAASGSVLKYTQSGGSVTINGQNPNTTNAKFEVLNSGSTFNMSGGNMLLVRGNNASQYGDFYLRPQSSVVSGGTITFSQGANNQTHIYYVESSVPLYNLVITGKNSGGLRDATVMLTTSPLVLKGNLTISNSQSFLDANISNNISVEVKGNLANSGTYEYRQNTTTFSGVSQFVTGSTTTNFYNLVVKPTTSLTLDRQITINNDLTITSGQLLADAYYIVVKGNVVNNASYDGIAGSGGLLLNGDAMQQISGSGSFGRLNIQNTNGVELLSDITLQKNLNLISGKLMLQEFLLSLTSTSEIEGSGFASNKMIATDGVFSSQGLKKTFTSYTGVEKTFEFPVGTGNKYTPAFFKYTDIGGTTTVRINPVNDNHPGVYDPANVLSYYWDVESVALDGFNGSLELHYLESDVNVTGTNTEAQYVSARLLTPGTQWFKSLVGPDDDNVDEINNVITFSFTGVDNISGEFSAGIDGAIPDDIPQYRSLADGNWNNAANWEAINGTTYPCPSNGPDGFIVVVDHEVTLNKDYCSAYRTEINGKLKAISGFVGHNLGTVSGAGTLYLDGEVIPAGRYTTFLSCEGNATLEYGGTSNYNLIADLYTSMPNLTLSGTGNRNMPNKDLTICKNLIVNQASLNNTVNNRTLTILGDFELQNAGAFLSGTGESATVVFQGASAQNIGSETIGFTGTNAFNNFEIRNTAGISINANSNVEIKGKLILTTGKITVPETSSLTITNTAIEAVTPLTGRSTSYVDGVLSKRINSGDSFFFPVGKGNVAGNKIELKETSTTGTQTWSVEFFTPNSTSEDYLDPLTYVNAKEYWKVMSVEGNQAKVYINWDTYSDLTPLMTTNGNSDMRVAEFISDNWNELSSSASGTNDAGNVWTTSLKTIAAAGNLFSSSATNPIKPRAQFTPDLPICGSTNIPLTFTANFQLYTPFTLTYKYNNVLQDAVTVNTVPYSLPANSHGDYQLVSFKYRNAVNNEYSGVVDPNPVTVYELPTQADAGENNDYCGQSSTTLQGNAPDVGTGLWEVISGTGYSFSNPASPTSTFSGVSGSAYTLRWIITNGECTSIDTVEVNFPLLAQQPAAFTAGEPAVCLGQTGVVYSVPNDPLVDYIWSYSGGGVTGIEATTNSVTLDFASTANSGTLSVKAVNDCGESLAREYVITVQEPAITVMSNDTGSDNLICTGTEVVFTAAQDGPLGIVSFEYLVNDVTEHTGAVFTTSTLNNHDTITVLGYTSAGCIATQEFVVYVGDQLWSGATSSAWDDLGNWTCPILPDNSRDVTIPPTAANMPTVSSDASIRNLTIENGASITHSGGVFSVYGDLINDGTLTTNATIRFTGAVAQEISGGGAVSFSTVEIDKSAGELTLNTPVTVSGNLTLTNGIVNSDATNIVTVDNGATASAGSETSFVNGPIKKIGNTDFTFPIGGSGRWARLGISGVVNGNVATEFVASYSHTPSPNLEDLEDAAVGQTLNNVSEVEHWDLANPTNDAGIETHMTLYWEDITRSNILDLADLRIAHFNGTKWVGHGGSGVSTGPNSGYITTTIPVSSFSPMTFGSESGSNPLPVELINFNANFVSAGVMLSWSTATEYNNSHFEIEHSTNMEGFVSLGRVSSKAANGNSNQLLDYHYTHNSAGSGQNYYRLKQVDFDGKFSYSKIVSISVDYDGGFLSDVTVFPNPTQGKLKLNIPESDDAYRISLYNANGSLLFEYTFEIQNPYLDLSTYQNGIFLLKISNGKDYIIQQIVKQ